jgi:ABC-type transport system involved in multi-copper enzyme maturation permease subunit
MKKLFVLTKNTFKDTIRQPIYAIIIIIALILLILSPSITMYTLDEDSKLLRELGLSTLFLASLFIAIFSASGTVAEEIESKTIETVLSKPIQRPIFIIAKFLGVALAVCLAHFICTIALLMAIRHGVLESVNDTHDWTVLTAAGVSIIAAFLLSALLNYIYDWKFTSTAVVLLAIFAFLSITFLFFIDKDWNFFPARNGLNALDCFGAVLLLPAAMIIAALAVTFSTRLNTAACLACCIGVFLLGITSDYAFGRLADNHIWAKALYFIIPNLQIFWVSDAIHEGSKLTFRYIAMAGSYSLCYTAAVLFVAIALFQRRQIG